MLEPRVIGSWYKEKELGSGGFGVVNLWINRSTKECLAVKKCNRLCASQISQRQGERWKLEVTIMEELDHENIVQFRRLPTILETELTKYNPSGLPILSLEYCSMGNLRKALMKPENSCGFSEGKVIDILNDTSSALQYLHEKNITHRDIKPENIVLQPSTSRRNGVIYKVIDLGYAKELDSGTVSFVGTLQYLAPEIFQCQHYTNGVDYWSLGVIAFEIICGVRPFLPTFPPMASFQHIKNKKMDVISIQITRTGDIDFSNKLLEENWLTSDLNTKITKWLRSVLQYNPEKRRSTEGGSVFDALKTIISTKTITVFCVYTYKFYSYEVTETTLFSTLVENICNDINLNPNDFYIVPTKTSKNNILAVDCYDESNREGMLFIIKKHAGFETIIPASIPSTIKDVLHDMKVQLNESSMRKLYAQTIYFVLKEEKHLGKFKDSICFFFDFIKNSFEIKKKMFAKIRIFLRGCLSEIEFYKKMNSSLFSKTSKTKNHAKVDQLNERYEYGICQLSDIIEMVNNDLLIRDKNTCLEFDQIEKLANDLIDHLGSYNYNDLKLKASKLLEFFYDDPITQKNASPTTLTVISKTIKIRDQLMKDALPSNFLRCASNYFEELNAFITILNDLRIKLHVIKDQLQNVTIEKVRILKLNCNDTSIKENVELRNENVLLQNKIEEILLTASLKIKNEISEINNEVDSMMEYSEM